MEDKEMNKQQFLSTGLLEQYVLGLASLEDTLIVERYIKRFPELKDEVEGMRSAIEKYAIEHSIPPPAELREEILSEIDKKSHLGRTGQNMGLLQHPYGRLALLTGFVAIGFGLLSAWLFNQSNRQNNNYQRLQAEYANYRESCEDQKQNAEQTSKIFAFLTDQGTLPVDLSGTELAPDAKAVVYWNDQEELAYFNNLNLPVPPSDKQYQVWADVHGEMKNLGLLETGIATLQPISFIREAESLNITLEPMGGSTIPTVEFLFANGSI